MSERVVVYARVSSNHQEEAGTIQSQLDHIRHNPRLAGREIAEVYADDGVSGFSKALWERPEGHRLLADAEAGELRGAELLVYKLDRLGRKAREVDEALDRLMAAGVKVVSVREGLELSDDSPSGRFIRQMFGCVAEMERGTIVQRSRDGMIRKAREGALAPTYARLGYDWSAVDGDGFKVPGARLVVNESEADLVRLIFDRVPTMATGRLAKWLNEQGHRLPCKSPRLRERYGRDSRMFTHKAIASIASDELYTGIFAWATKPKSPGERPQEFRHHRPGVQIVSFEAFRRVRDALANRRVVPQRSQTSPYMFSGLIRCPRCGGKTVGKRQRHAAWKGKPTMKRYECRAYNSMGKAACTGWSSYEQTVKKALVPFLADLLERKLGVRALLEDAAREMRREQTGDLLQPLQAEVLEAERTIRKVQEGFETDLYTGEEARARILEARERKERAERQMTNLEGAEGVRQELADALRLLERPLADFLDEMQPQHLARLCRAVFERVSIRAEGYGWERRAKVASYEFTPYLKQALIDTDNFRPTTPAVEMV